MQTVLVVGTFRSGTNAAQTALMTHFDTKAVFNKWFWKHGVPPTLPNTPVPIPASVPIIVMAKDPVKLNESLFRFWRARRPELKVGDDISKFVRNRFVVYDNTQTDQRPFYYYPTPTEYWNQFYFSWQNWKAVEKRIHFVKCEDLMENTDTVLRTIGDRFDLVRRTDGPMELPKERIGPQSPASLETGVRALNQNDKKFIRSCIDPQVAHKLGY